MKTISNITLEGTCNGDIVGGLLLWTGLRTKKKPLDAAGEFSKGFKK